MVKRNCVYCSHKNEECHFVSWDDRWPDKPSKSSYVCVCHFPTTAYNITRGKVYKVNPMPAPQGTSIDSVEISKEDFDDLMKTKEILASFLTDDQIRMLKGETIKQYSQETINKALGIKLVCHNQGYNYIKSTGYPLPCLKTIQNHTSSVLQMAPGYLYEYGHYLGKIDIPSINRHAVLIFDEMEITSGIQFNRTLKNMSGYACEELTQESYYDSDDPNHFTAKFLFF